MAGCVLGVDFKADRKIENFETVVKFLCSRNCPATEGVDASADGNCAMRWASENEHLDAVKFRCERKAVQQPKFVRKLTTANMATISTNMNWEHLLRLLHKYSDVIETLVDNSESFETGHDAKYPSLAKQFGPLLESVAGKSCDSEMIEAATTFIESGIVKAVEPWLRVARYLGVAGFGSCRILKQVRRYGDVELLKMSVSVGLLKEEEWMEKEEEMKEDDMLKDGLYWKLPEEIKKWIEAGHVDCVKWCLEDGCALPENALILACKLGHLKLVKFLTIELSVDASAQDNYAVCWASLNGHLDVVKFLCSGSCPATEGVDASAQDNFAVRWASENGHLDVVKFLCSRNCPATEGVDASAQDNFAVRWASENGHLDVVKFLCERSCPATEGVDASAPDNMSMWWASCNGHLDVVKFLCERSCPATEGVDASADGNCAVQWASDNGQLGVVKFLCSRSCHATEGVDASANDNYAVRWASKNGHLDVVKFLCERSCPATEGVDALADDNYAVRWASKNGHLDVVKFLCERSCPATARVLT